MIACIDFDGTLTEEGALEGVQRLARRGWTIVVLTANRPEYVERRLRDMGLWRYVDRVTNLKPVADVYIDDRALHFESWTQVNGTLESWQTASRRTRARA